MACVFWDSQGVTVVNSEPSVVNADYYSTLLSDQLRGRPAIRRKRPNLLWKGVMLQHDNAAPHKTVEKVAMME